jgi:eukaryotic-like serine/threonine-protein kinase
LKLLEPGTLLDGFEVGRCIHAGGMAHIYEVRHAPSPDGSRRKAEFPMAMKIPRMTAGDGAETILSFEVELMILPSLSGPHVPRFVASGDLSRLPYLVMEYIEGHTLAHWLENQQVLAPTDIARLGAAVAKAAHSLHRQNVCHLDIKPANVLIRPDGSAVFLDFGLSCHAHYPDLLAEEFRKAVGSPIWIAPEQVVGMRGDPRSDVFAIGVMLYQLATGETPFGEPATAACGWTRCPRASGAPTCPSGCKKSSCAAWSPRPISAMPRLRCWLLT